MKTIKHILRVLLTPTCWVRNYPTNRAWDMRLNKLMDKHKFVLRTEYSAMIGDVLVWIGNHPYSSFKPYDVGMLPSRKTTFRAMDKLADDIVSDE